MYSNAQYVKNLSGNISGIFVEIDGVASTVPIDASNTDYQKIMALVDAGELVIAPAEGGN